MGGILKDSSAPYVLTIIVSLIGWMFGAAVKNGESVWVIEYDIEHSEENSAHVVTVLFKNKSLIKPLNEGRFVIHCGDEKFARDGELQCFTNLPGLGNVAQPVATGGIFSAGNPEKIDNKAIGVPAYIPSGASTGYRVGLGDAASRILIGYAPDPANKAASSQMMLTNGWSIEGLIFSNYIRLTGLLFLALLVVLFIWFVAEFFRRKPGAAETPPPPREIIIKLEIGGRTHEIVDIT